MPGNSTTKYGWVYSDKRWPDLRIKTLRRFRFKCSHCGVSVQGKGKARVDHIVPVSEEPSRAFDPSNLRVLCTACDAARHHEKGLGGVSRPQIGLDGWPVEES